MSTSPAIAGSGNLTELKLLRGLIHLAFRTGTIRNRLLKEFAASVRNKKILELGSGSRSVSEYFDKSNEFLPSDINPDYGYPSIDVTKMDFEEEFDIIICLNVLEHVFDFQAAIMNVFRALKREGILVVGLPGFYPLHDEPRDYWRFTEHAVRMLLDGFEIVRWKRGGPRRFPFWYYVEASKKESRNGITVQSTHA